MIQAPEDQRIVVRQQVGAPTTPRLFVYGAVREFTMGGSKVVLKIRRRAKAKVCMGGAVCVLVWRTGCYLEDAWANPRATGSPVTAI